METFAKILEVAGPIAGILVIAELVAAGVMHLLARQTAENRETMRKLRVALEHDPSPGQLGQALQMWPEAAKYPPTVQRQELVKQATLAEHNKADRTEFIKGVVRFLLGLAFLCAVIFIMSRFIRPSSATEEPAEPTAMRQSREAPPAFSIG